MRWQIPLVVALALTMTLGCDQQPLEPVTDDAATAPLFAPKSNGNQFVWDADEAWQEVCAGGEVVDVTMVGWAQFMSKKGNHNWEVDVFHLVFTFTYGGAEFIYRDVGPDRFYCDESECYVTVSGRSSASGTPNRDEINIGHAVLKLDGPFGDPVDVVFLAGRGLGTLTDLACSALT